MTKFLLIRHAAHDLLGKVLAGRAPAVHLNLRGKLEAERLSEALATRPVAAIYTSPRERAWETARPLASRLRLEAGITPAFDEIDFGAWTSASFAELESQPEWHLWNEFRADATPPGGEGMAAVQTRVTTELERLAKIHVGETVAIVSHGDVIKAGLMSYLQISLNLYCRLEISPASVSELWINGAAPQVISINTVVGL